MKLCWFLQNHETAKYKVEYFREKKIILLNYVTKKLKKHSQLTVGKE